jgi:hypothetical protein
MGDFFMLKTIINHRISGVLEVLPLDDACIEAPCSFEEELEVCWVGMGRQIG